MAVTLEGVDHASSSSLGNTVGNNRGSGGVLIGALVGSSDGEESAWGCAGLLVLVVIALAGPIGFWGINQILPGWLTANSVWWVTILMGWALIIPWAGVDSQKKD